MNLSAIEDEVLGRCADDYEAPHTIAGDLTRKLGRTVSETEVRAAFLSLTERGLVQAYRCDKLTSGYVAISNADAARDEATWFFITTQGRSVQD